MGKYTLDVKIKEQYRLSTFGLCSNIKIKTLQQYIRLLYSKDIVNIDYLTNHVKLTISANNILRNKLDIFLPLL